MTLVYGKKDFLSRIILQVSTHGLRIPRKTSMVCRSAEWSKLESCVGSQSLLHLGYFYDDLNEVMWWKRSTCGERGRLWHFRFDSWSWVCSYFRFGNFLLGYVLCLFFSFYPIALFPFILNSWTYCVVLSVLMGITLFFSIHKIKLSFLRNYWTYCIYKSNTMVILDICCLILQSAYNITNASFGILILCMSVQAQLT